MPHEHHSGDRLNILSVDENFDTTLTCPESIWFHPLLQHKPCADPISKDQLRKFAYDYFLKFLPFFRNQSEGCIGSGVQIEVTRRLKSRLGLAYMFERRINLNENYFASEPALQSSHPGLGLHSNDRHTSVSGQCGCCKKRPAQTAAGWAF